MTAEKDRTLPKGDVTEVRREKPVLHLRREDLGMRQMEGDALAQKYRERYYLTMCGVEASSARTTNVRTLGPLAAAFSVLCADCEATP